MHNLKTINIVFIIKDVILQLFLNNVMVSYYVTQLYDTYIEILEVSSSFLNVSIMKPKETFILLPNSIDWSTYSHRLLEYQDVFVSTCVYLNGVFVYV